MELLVTGKFRLNEKIRVTLKVNLLVSKYINNCAGCYLCLLLEFNKKGYCPHGASRHVKSLPKTDLQILLVQSVHQSLISSSESTS